MIEVIWHGRGGQGAFTAAKLLGAAAAGHVGLHALAFPSFGPERRGAPMRAFTKIDAKPVADRSIPARADIVVYLDETLVDENWRGECRGGAAGGAGESDAAACAAPGAAGASATTVLVNHGKAGRTADGVLCLPASAIAAEALGRDIPNTAFLGAICELAEVLDASDAERAIDELMPPRLCERNKQAVRLAAAAARELACEDAPTCAGPLSAHGGIAAEGVAHDDAEAAGVAHGGAEAGEAARGQADGRPDSVARLRRDAIDYEAIAQTTCFPSGYLDHGNAGWRSVRPVVDAGACVGCLRCWEQCPDACIIRRDGADGDARQPVGVDYALCKGCGICARACPLHAIAMIPEHGEEPSA